MTRVLNMHILSGSVLIGIIGTIRDCMQYYTVVFTLFTLSHICVLCENAHVLQFIIRSLKLTGTNINVYLFAKCFLTANSKCHCVLHTGH